MTCNCRFLGWFGCPRLDSAWTKSTFSLDWGCLYSHSPFWYHEIISFSGTPSPVCKHIEGEQTEVGYLSELGTKSGETGDCISWPGVVQDHWTQPMANWQEFISYSLHHSCNAFYLLVSEQLEFVEGKTSSMVIKNVHDGIMWSPFHPSWTTNLELEYNPNIPDKKMTVLNSCGPFQLVLARTQKIKIHRSLWAWIWWTPKLASTT